MAKSKYKLNPELKGQFKIVNKPASNRIMHPVYGVIDFEKITARQATVLAVADDFEFLEAVAGSD